MNIFDLLHNRLLTRNDIVNTSQDKCLLCCFIYCCLPFIEISENRREHEEVPFFSEFNDDCPDRFFTMVRDS